MGNKTKHTTIYLVTGPTEATKITGLRQAGVPDGQAAQIDVSTWDDDWDKFESGRKSTGSSTIEIIHDTAAHEKLEEFYASGAVTEFLILAPLSETAPAVAPTVVGSAFQAVTAVDTIKFKGYIANYTVTLNDNDVWRATLTIQGNGPRTVTKKTP